MYDTGFAGVATGLNHAFHRGFDPASYTALLTAITAADAWTVINGGQPILLPQAQIIAKSLLLEEHRDMEFPEWIHMALDGLAMVPVVDILADGLNAILYFFRGDNVNAGVSLASVFSPQGNASVFLSRLPLCLRMNRLS